MSENLNVTITPHREFIPADTEQQRLFVMLQLQPTRKVATARPATNFVLVIDTSGSMREIVTDDFQLTGRTITEDGLTRNEAVGGRTKIDMVIAALQDLIHSNQFGPQDRVAIVQFNDSASVLVGLTPATQTHELEAAINQLRDFSGGTSMGKGLKHALDLLASQDMSACRTLLFTDGQTFDEDQCQTLAKDFRVQNIPIAALGVGEEYNENLLLILSDTTGGSTRHVVPNHASGTQVAMADLPSAILEEFSQAQQEVITNLALQVKTVKGVNLSRIVRAYPSQAEFPLTDDPYPMGNVAANDETIFILEFSVDNRPASRVRIAQLGLTYDIPGQNLRGEFPPQNLVVQFVAGQGGAAQVDQTVMHYVQQCNIAQLVNEATRVAEQDPQKAEGLLETARRMTVRIGNQEMAESLNNAQDELRKTQKISSGTRKTVKIGAKGKTVKMTGNINDSISEEQIRNLTGT